MADWIAHHTFDALAILALLLLIGSLLYDIAHHNSVECGHPIVKRGKRRHCTHHVLPDTTRCAAGHPTGWVATYSIGAGILAVLVVLIALTTPVEPLWRLVTHTP